MDLSIIQSVYTNIIYLFFKLLVWLIGIPNLIDNQKTMSGKYLKFKKVIKYCRHFRI